ncbi:MAG: glycoside hydrolase family 18 protein [Polyangiales bacterium]
MASRIVLLSVLALLACGDKRRGGTVGTEPPGVIAESAPTPGDSATLPPAAPSAPPSTPTSKHWVTGYYAAYQRASLPPSQIDWSGLSHIVFTRLKTEGGGRLLFDFDIDPTNGPALAREVASRAHQNGKKALLMLGGEGTGGGIKDSASDTHRAAFVEELLRAVKILGYDGLDLDWEDGIDYDLFIALARALRSSPNAPPGLILTVPGLTVNRNYQTVDPKIATLVQSLDQYNLMSYYPATAYAGTGWLSWHNCPLTGAKLMTPVAIDDSLLRYVRAGVPREKLGLGVAFYAICYTGSVTAPNLNTMFGTSIQGGDNDFPLSALFGAQGAFDPKHRHWDAEAQVPYLSLPEPERHGCRYVSFEDEQSLVQKGNFVRSEGYGGVIVWTINQGYIGPGGKLPPNALTQALKRGFLDP